MTRAVLAVLVVVTSVVREARADEPRCECDPGTTVLPADGAVDVPLNAKLWSLGYRFTSRVVVNDGTRDLYGVDPEPLPTTSRTITRYSLGDLASRHTYTISEPGSPSTTFTTSAAVDNQVPAAPVIRRLAVSAALANDRDHEDTADLDLDAAFDPDVALVRITIATDTARASVITVPGGWRFLGKPACGTWLRLHPYQLVTITLTAIDLAGNESAPVTREVIATDGGKPLLEPCGVSHHTKCGMGALGIMFFGMIVAIIGFVVLIGIIVRHFTRVRSLGFAVAQPVSGLVAERLARAVQVRAGLVATVALVGVPTFFVMVDSMLSILATVIACVALRSFFIARGILTMLDDRAAEAEALGHRLVVRVGEAESHLDLTEDKIARARRKFSIPVAKL